MKKKIAALALAAAISAAAIPSAYAEVYSASVTVMAQAESAEEWNGKTALEAGKSYVVSRSITVSSDMVIPSKTTVTVKNGAKIWVSSKGKLTVKGSLVLQKNSTLAVTGDLALAKGKVIKSSGEIRFSAKSDVVINGKLSVTKYGTITGEPSTLSVGSKAVVKITGANNSAKLSAALMGGELTQEDIDEIAEIVEEYTYSIFVKGDVYAALTAQPKTVVAAMEAEMEQMYGTEYTLKELCDGLGAFLMAAYAEYYGGCATNTVVSDLVITQADPTEIPGGSVMSLYGNVTKAAKVSGSYGVVVNGSTIPDGTVEGYMVCDENGDWYMFLGSEDLDELLAGESA